MPDSTKKTGQLALRFWTALVLIPLVVGSVFLLPTEQLGILFAVFVLAGSLEWSYLVPIKNLWARIAYSLLMLLMLWWAGTQALHTPFVEVILWIACGWWVLAFGWVRHHEFGSTGSRPVCWIKGFAGFLTLLPAWVSILALHASGPRGPLLVICLLIVIWVADSGAYFAGKRWGSHRLAKMVSPGKTWEGFYGGLLAGGTFALPAGLLLGWKGMQLFLFVLLCLFTMLFSVVGDLMESLLKRHQGLKDSGAILPGHGGILDRIDGLAAAAPVFALGILLF